MPEALEHGDFAPLVGNTFQLRSPAVESPIDAVLIDVKPLDPRGAPTHLRTPFSIQFQLPNEYPLPQGMLDIRHPELTASSIFAVPIGTDENGWYMEACFG